MDNLTKVVSLLQLGKTDYFAASRLQEGLAAARARGKSGDLLLLLEHPPAITVGLGGGWADILAPTVQLEQEGICLHATDRGGRATYHGPGQLVAYPILALADGNAYEHLWRLEETAIGALAAFNLLAGRSERYPGVWLNGRKIASVGVAVSRGVTRHGLALNVDPNLAHFELLIPCGIAGGGVTSMARELGRPIEVQEVTTPFLESFSSVFGCSLLP